jgi:predicted MFS family arabinose efflux permease
VSAATISQSRSVRRFGPLLAAYAFAVTMVGTTLPTPLYPIYRSEFGFSQFVVTVVFATYAVGVILALLLFGNASDSIGRRRAMLPGLVLSALSAVVFLLAHGVGLLLVGRLLSGLSAGIFTGTATVAVVELAEPERRNRATLLATVANIGGLGCGPLLAGLLAQYVGSPLRLPFVVDLALLVPAFAAVLILPETVSAANSGSRFRFSVLRPTVPAEVRTVFIRGAIAAFAGFAVLGLFTAVAPSFLGQILGVHNAAAVGAVVFAVFASSTLGQLALERVPGPRGLVVGCTGLVLGMGVLAVGLALESLVLLVVGGCVAGFGQGLSFRSGLGAVNQQCPADQRAAVASTFFVIAYIAISLPVVGVGLLARSVSLKTTGLVFAGIVMVLAAVAAGLLLRQERSAGAAGRADDAER